MNVDEIKMNNIADEIFNIIIEEGKNKKVFFSFYSQAISKKTQKIKKMRFEDDYFKKYNFIVRKYGSKHGEILKTYKYLLSPYESEYLIQKLKSYKYTPLLIPISFVNRKINYHIKSCSNCISNYHNVITNKEIRRLNNQFRKKVNDEAKILTKSYQNQVEYYKSKLLNIEYKANDVLSMYKDLINNDDDEICYAKVSLGMTKDILYSLGLLDENGEVIKLTE